VCVLAKTIGSPRRLSLTLISRSTSGLGKLDTRSLCGHSQVRDSL
jgi:hypothetical protein